MKTSIFTLLIIAGVLTVNAQKPRGGALINPTIKISLVDTMLTGACNLSAAQPTDTIYIHSGAGTEPDSAWDHIVGHWGLADQVGEMVTDSPYHYSICFNIYDYYSHATIDTDNLGGTGEGPMMPGDTAYNIGLVFRLQDCPANVNGLRDCAGTQTGKDDQCDDIYIEGIPSGSPQIASYSGDPVPAVTMQIVESCAIYANPLGGFSTDSTSGIKNVSQANPSLSAFPNPFTNSLNIQFNTVDQVGTKIELYDILGRMVADFNGTFNKGANSILWNGEGLDGNTLQPGVYMLKLSTGNNIIVNKVIKQ